MTRAVLSLGSNLGDRLARLKAAVDDLGGDVVAVSSVYRTPPWGPIEQDDYLNIVLIVDAPDRDAPDWLTRCQELERAAERVRDIRWGPRTLDADVVTVGDVVSDDPELILPHPRAHERAFVLVPWSEIEPAAELPGHGPIAALLLGMDTSDIVRVGQVGGADVGVDRGD